MAWEARENGDGAPDSLYISLSGNTHFATKIIEQLSHIERKLDMADQRAFEADAKTNELKKLNRPFFLPSWGAKSGMSRGIVSMRIHTVSVCRFSYLLNENSKP